MRRDVRAAYSNFTHLIAFAFRKKNLKCISQCLIRFYPPLLQTWERNEGSYEEGFLGKQFVYQLLINMNISTVCSLKEQFTIRSITINNCNGYKQWWQLCVNELKLKQQASTSKKSKLSLVLCGLYGDIMWQYWFYTLFFSTYTTDQTF